jgi:hypothetical protein
LSEAYSSWQTLKRCVKVMRMTTHITPSIIPPPWTLHGRGFVLVYRFSREWVLDAGFVPAEMKDHYVGGLGSVMLVDYADSPCGPYHELLFIPGQFTINNRRLYSITRIYVSTEASVVNGRTNWGIPKFVGRFTHEQQGTQESYHLYDGQQIAAILKLERQSGLRLPVTTAIVPGFLRALVHPHERGWCRTVVGAQGWLQRATLVEARFDPRLFPDFTHGQFQFGLLADLFTLHFPRPHFG